MEVLEQQECFTVQSWTSRFPCSLGFIYHHSLCLIPPIQLTTLYFWGWVLPRCS